MQESVSQSSAWLSLELVPGRPDASDSYVGAPGLSAPQGACSDFSGSHLESSPSSHPAPGLASSLSPFMTTLLRYNLIHPLKVCNFFLS